VAARWNSKLSEKSVPEHKKEDTHATPTLSALVVAHNEERQLEACLFALKFADELVVVLDKCTDRSKEIAGKFAHQIIEGAWEIEGERRNLGIDACKSDWILEIDADERVSETLAQEIRATIADAAPGHFLIPFNNYVGDRLVRYGWGGYTSVNYRATLFSRGTKRWGMERVHPKLELGPKHGSLRNGLDHYVDRNLSDMINRLNRYTSARAADLRARGVDEGLFHNVRRIFSRSWKSYVGRRGYREGRYGIMLAIFAGLYPILSYLKATLEDE